MPPPLISVDELLARIRRDPARAPALLDIRWELGAGPQRDEYVAGHLPGAAFVDLDADLSAPPRPGSGRHPLPDAGPFTAAMRRAGVRVGHPVVVYDAATGMAAARAWWLLRYFGHGDVRLLDGGLAAWRDAGGPLAAGDEAPPAGDFMADPGHLPLLDAAAAGVLARRGVLLDARTPERFRGDSEPVDPVGGHIPGARNRPTALNLHDSGRFRSAAELRAGFAAAGAAADVEVGAYCGSGVSAAHQVLALELAGIPAALYAGSWSEWVADPDRPVATGDG